MTFAGLEQNRQQSVSRFAMLFSNDNSENITDSDSIACQTPVEMRLSPNNRKSEPLSMFGKSRFSNFENRKSRKNNFQDCCRIPLMFNHASEGERRAVLGIGMFYRCSNSGKFFVNRQHLSNPSGNFINSGAIFRISSRALSEGSIPGCYGSPARRRYHFHCSVNELIVILIYHRIRFSRSEIRDFF